MKKGVYGVLGEGIALEQTPQHLIVNLGVS